MSVNAKRAAEALVKNDMCISEEIDLAITTETTESRVLAMKTVKGSWTLTLAAEAAGVTERSILVAIAKHTLRIKNANMFVETHLYNVW